MGARHAWAHAMRGAMRRTANREEACFMGTLCSICVVQSTWQSRYFAGGSQAGLSTEGRAGGRGVGLHLPLVLLLRLFTK